MMIDDAGSRLAGSEMPGLQALERLPHSGGVGLTLTPPGCVISANTNGRQGYSSLLFF